MTILHETNKICAIVKHLLAFVSKALEQNGAAQDTSFNALVYVFPRIGVYELSAMRVFGSYFITPQYVFNMYVKF